MTAYKYCSDDPSLLQPFFHGPPALVYGLALGPVPPRPYMRSQKPPEAPPQISRLAICRGYLFTQGIDGFGGKMGEKTTQSELHKEDPFRPEPLNLHWFEEGEGEGLRFRA